MDICGLRPEADRNRNEISFTVTRLSKLNRGLTPLGPAVNELAAAQSLARSGVRSQSPN